MNAKSLLAASVLSMLAALSFSARAAGDAEAAENKVPASAEVKPPPVKKVTRHSHLEEKVGASSKVSKDADHQPVAASGKPKHDHQRDAK